MQQPSSNNMPPHKSKQSLRASPRVNGEQRTAGDGKQYYTIQVGGALREPFVVDKNLEGLLRAASPFFSDKFEKQKRLITLPKFDPQDFQIYSDWLHARRLNPCPQITVLEDSTKWRRICQAYLLGEHLEDFSYCNTVTEVLLRTASKSAKQPPKDFLADAEHVFGATVEESPIRKLFIDICIYWAQSGTWAPELKSSPEFSSALCGEQFKRRGITRSPFEAGADTCQYHYHPPGDFCHAGTDASLWMGVKCMFNDWAHFISTNIQGIINSCQAFHPCVTSTYTVLIKLGRTCKAAFSWCRNFLRTHL